ncbi:hypothetical protein VTN02DRAFT_1251 [Thermoascus thermophilus]
MLGRDGGLRWQGGAEHVRAEHVRAEAVVGHFAQQRGAVGGALHRQRVAQAVGTHEVARARQERPTAGHGGGWKERSSTCLCDHVLIHVNSSSSSSSPSSDSLLTMSLDDSPGKVPDNQPNPVMVGPGLKTMGDGAYEKASHATPSLDVDKHHPTATDAPSYFHAIPGGSTDTPVDAAAPASSGVDLLRRLSLAAGVSPVSPEGDPRAAHPGLHLSGRIISAALCIPYKLGYRAGADWVLSSTLRVDRR